MSRSVAPSSSTSPKVAAASNCSRACCRWTTGPDVSPGRAPSPEGHPMTATPEAWPRPYWQPSDETLVLNFYVFGRFAEDLAIPAARYASRGLPEGVALQRFGHNALRGWEGYPLKGALGELLKEDAPDAFEQARSTPDVLVVRGELSDRDSLDYLRDTLGVLAGLLDVGGVGILDPQILTLFDAEAWRRHYLVPGGAPPRNHVLILRNPDDEGRSHIHTRGLRK